MSSLEKELLEDIYKHLEEIIGEKALKVFKREIENSESTDVPAVVFKIAREMEKTLGKKGAYSILRELGRTVARDLMNSHPKEEWERVFREGLNIMGFAKGVKREPTRACICSCVFYPRFLEREGLKPTEHPVCWIGWGFVEGFMKAFTGAKGVRFVKRDFAKRECWFELVNL
jgi:predicted hydrocarbon binding protein